MSIEHFIQVAVNQKKHAIDFLEQTIKEYHMNELTNGHMGDTPSVNGVHPLALEYGAIISADDPTNYTSILPAVGVELINDSPMPGALLGRGFKVEEVTQDFIDEVTAINMKDRYDNGMIMSDKTLTAIQAMKTAKGSEKLYARRKRYLQDQTMVISMWSDHIEITDMLYLVIHGALKRLMDDFSQNGAKNVTVRGEQALYNYEFGRTLFGSEFNITLVNSIQNVAVDDSLETIKSYEHHFDETGKEGPRFQPIAEDEPYPEE